MAEGSKNTISNLALKSWVTGSLFALLRNQWEVSLLTYIRLFWTVQKTQAFITSFKTEGFGTIWKKTTKIDQTLGKQEGVVSFIDNGCKRYSPSLWHGFCPVKRTGKYFTKDCSKWKVLVIEVVGLYSTYQKCKRIGVPSSYQFGENWTWVFSTKKLQKSKHFFSKN